MVTISTIILALTLIPIIVDGLLGLIRGRNRSILRLILVIISAVIAIFAIKPIIGSVMSAEVEGQPLKDFVASQLLQGGNEFPTELADLIFMIIEMFVSVILYFVVFLVVKFITWLIVFPILKIFVKFAYLNYSLMKQIFSKNFCLKKKIKLLDSTGSRNLMAIGT